MDDDDDVAIIEQPDGSMLETLVRVASNGGAGRVRSNGKGSKSASASDRAIKFKKQHRAPGKYVLPKQWRLIRQYRTCIRDRFDAEDIKFDMYVRAHKFMELSGNVMLPEQEEVAGKLHL